MRIGEQLAVGPLLVERLSDVDWAVREPGGLWCVVSDDPFGWGWLGEGWAVEAVVAANSAATEPEPLGVTS